MSQAVIFGASGGIGAALVEAVVAKGRYERIWAGSRSGQAAPAGAVPFAFDLTDEASIASAAGRIGGNVSLVFVATGVLSGGPDFQPEKTYKAQDPAAYAHAFAINATGPALIGKHFLPLLPRRERAVFAALTARVGSIADNRLGGWHAYRASKAALNMILRNFAIELRRTHPQAVVAALHPGTVATDLSAPFTSMREGQRLFTPDEAARYLLDVIDGLTLDDSGKAYGWDGQPIPF
ncbi:SDR family NAD(P)-dependent oxidoreductase [Novosphingobium ginsenosidimutans]|uniref:SDR family NAD(P)-dependent oxidoreductase n=1 Tax=Novosphingobium ginsenosidimutans TaxID=1176536 RepID=A0A5B8RZ25_9SPHN|nr:SDR family NAD(P)-dependent oxidoreductase [Novosphingobium ginsenosidimutans]QEA14720.1 SDR family NAD(P)-dependent oxidoreductase [Novosphingobium ginsenosidimutans]